MVEPAETFSYEKPETGEPKEIARLCETDLLKADIQVVREDGANNMHAHTGNDGFWFVLDGAARFYGDGDEVLAEPQANEGILIPRGLKYWFESIGEDDLEIVHVAAFSDTVEDHRIDHEHREREESKKHRMESVQ